MMERKGRRILMKWEARAALSERPARPHPPLTGPDVPAFATLRRGWQSGCEGAMDGGLREGQGGAVGEEKRSRRGESNVES